MLNDKTILVTGANGGLGRALCEVLAEKGANLIAHELAPRDDFTAWVEGLARERKISICPVYCDLTDVHQVERTFGELADSNLRIDGLLNCAGVAHGGYFQMTPMAELRRVFEINFFALASVTQVILRHMVRNGGGAIVNIGSTNGLDLQAGQCAYGVSKAAVMAFTKTIAAEAAAFGVRVNAIAPGLMDTEMGRTVDQKTRTRLVARSAMGRLIDPVAVANVAAFLLSDDAAFVNGEVVSVDGGKA